MSVITPETREKQSRARKAIWADPEQRARYCAAFRKAWDDPLRLACARAAHNRPDTRARHAAASREALADPAIRQKLSEAAKRRWSSKEQRDAQARKMKAFWRRWHKAVAR